MHGARTNPSSARVDHPDGTSDPSGCSMDRVTIESYAWSRVTSAFEGAARVISTRTSVVSAVHWRGNDRRPPSRNKVHTAAHARRKAEEAAMLPG
jgi:hypothetical protein